MLFKSLNNVVHNPVIFTIVVVKCNKFYFWVLSIFESPLFSHVTKYYQAMSYFHVFYCV